MYKAWWFALIVTVATPHALAQMYEWRDGQGRLTYGDRPPAGTDARMIKSQAASPVAPPAAPTLAEQDQASRERRNAAAEAGQAREREAEIARICTDARNQLAALESDQPLARLNAQGEQELLNADTRAEETARTRAFIAENCQ